MLDDHGFLVVLCFIPNRSRVRKEVRGCNVPNTDLFRRMFCNLHLPVESRVADCHPRLSFVSLRSLRVGSPYFRDWRLKLDGRGQCYKIITCMCESGVAS